MTLETAATRRLGIALPIAQAPIGGASTPELAAAVSNAGGLGTLSVTWRDPAALPGMLRRVRDLTGRPFAVNLVLAWDPAERLAIALDAGVPIVSFFWGDPAPWVGTVHRAGGLVVHTVGSVEEARQAVAAGVDLLVAQGVEAGGHVRGSVGTTALVPAVVAVAEGVPVLAAGGIVDGRGVAAALALGAAGAWMGTRFVVAEESAAHPVWKRAVLAAGSGETWHGTLFDGGWEGAPLRSLRNSTWAAWDAAGRPPHGTRPGEGEVVATGEDGRPILRYSNDGPIVGASGGVEAMCLYAGQGVGGVAREQPAAEIVREVAAEATEAIRSLSALAPPA